MTLRIGVFGAGFIARYHLGMLRAAATPHEVVGVHDPDAEKAARLAADLEVTVLASEEALLDAVDVVYVCTWTAEHPRLVAAAAARGLAVFCEKPLAVDLATSTELASSVQAAGVVNQVGLVLRDSPAFRLLHTWVQAPSSGRVLSVVFRDDQYLPTQGMYESSWRGDAALAGSGTLLEHSIHDLDLLEWLFGTVTAVSCQTRARHGLDGIEDVAVVTLCFADGAVASLTSVWHDVLARPSQRRMEVLCEDACFTLEGDVWGPVRWERDGADGPDRGALEASELIAGLAETGATLRNPDDAFLAAVEAGVPATPDVTVALRAHVIADACYRSAAAGGAPVAVDPPDATATS